MNFQHKLGEGAEVILDDADLKRFEETRFCMTDRGLEGLTSPVRVYAESWAGQPVAEIGSNNDLDIYVPPNASFPLEIASGDISAPLDRDRLRVDHYFGRHGGMVLRVDSGS